MEEYVRAPDVVRTERLINPGYFDSLADPDYLNDFELQRVIDESIDIYETQKRYEDKIVKLKEESDRKYAESLSLHNKYLEEKRKLDLIKNNTKRTMLRDIIAYLTRTKKGDVNREKIYFLVKTFNDSDGDSYDISVDIRNIYAEFIEELEQLQKKGRIRQESIDYLIDAGLVENEVDDYGDEYEYNEEDEF